MDISAVLQCIERYAPPAYAASWDKSGVQIAGTRSEVARLAVTLDPTPAAVAEALDWSADFILAHHPLSLSPSLPSRPDAYHEVLRLVLGSGAWLYSAHTSLDVQTRGPAAWLAAALGLERVRPLSAESARRSVEVRFPIDPASMAARSELFGRIEKARGVIRLRYDLSGGEFHLVCWTDGWPGLRSMLGEALGPDFSPLVVDLAAPRRDLGYGFVGDLPEPMAWQAFAGRLMDLLERGFLSVAGPEPGTVRRLACCPGSGSSLMQEAFAAGADVFVTGDLKYHQAMDAAPFGDRSPAGGNGERMGGCVVDAGHFALEERMMRELAGTLQDSMGAAVAVRFFQGREPIRLLVRPEGRAGALLEVS